MVLPESDGSRGNTNIPRVFLLRINSSPAWMLVLIAVCPLAGATWHCLEETVSCPSSGLRPSCPGSRCARSWLQPRVHLHPGLGAPGGRWAAFFFFNAAEKLVCTQQRECLQNFYSSKAFCSPSWPDGRGGTQVASRLSAEAGWTWVNGCEPDSICSQFCLLQFSWVAQSCLTLCNPMDCSTSDFPVHHQLPDFAQTHIHQVSDAIWTSHPLLSPSPPAFNLSQHQGLFQGVHLCIRWPKYCSFSFSISASSDCSGLISFSMDWFDVLAVQGTLKSLVSHDVFLICSSTAWT